MLRFLLKRFNLDTWMPRVKRGGEILVSFLKEPILDKRQADAKLQTIFQRYRITDGLLSVAAELYYG